MLDHMAQVAREGGECIAISDGWQSLIDVIECLVGAFGRCSLLVCSASVHEDSMVRLVELERRGAVDWIGLFLSCELLKLNPLSFRGAKRIAGDRLRLARSHAKFVVLGSGDRFCSVLTSANLNKNQRHESYLVSSSVELAFELSWFCLELERAGAVPGRESAYYLDSHRRVLSSGRVGESAGKSLSELIRRV